MNAHVNAISNRLSLRMPQRQSLERLHRVVERITPDTERALGERLALIQEEFPAFTDFERDFPSLCFALATGVGKTRLMGAFIAYLTLARGIRNYFVLAPNLTIYNKLIQDFTPNTPKYVFKGVGEFAAAPPLVVTGDSYEEVMGTVVGAQNRVRINIFNISKINSEVRGSKAPRIKRLSEYLGQSYFDYLAELKDLVLLMDESHRYRASAGVKAINELKPILGLELTATPFVETSKGTVPFKNVLVDYALGRAIADGFVKEPAVVTRKNFNPAGMSPEAIERLKLEDGVRLHENVKVQLETYAFETGNPVVKPFLLVIARDTRHASELCALIESEAFFEGVYKGRVLQVDSSRSGAEEDAMVARLLKVEHREEPTEIVVHVNMLKEGWDVSNLYTIVPLRAANARILIEQSIGRGLRLPYGKRTGVDAVDRLNIVAHDKFQEIVEEANRPDSAIRLQTLVLSSEELETPLVSKRITPLLDLIVAAVEEPGVAGTETLAERAAEGASSASATLPVGSSGGTGAVVPEGNHDSGSVTPSSTPSSTPVVTPEERPYVQAALMAIREQSRQVERVPGSQALTRPEVQAELVRKVVSAVPQQLVLVGVKPSVDVAAVVSKAIALHIRHTIDIPRISVQPVGEVESRFVVFKLDFVGFRPLPPSEDLWLNYLRTNESQVLTLNMGVAEQSRLEDYVVDGLVAFDDVWYMGNEALLYELAGQVVRHLRTYLQEDDIRRVLRTQQQPIARFVHAQLRRHHSETAKGGYEVKVAAGFVPLREGGVTARREDVLYFRQVPPEKSRMSSYVFEGFERCLYPRQKFDSDSERRLAVILEREALKWFKPLENQFQISYRLEGESRMYQPDFVAETGESIYMLEPKAQRELGTPEVQAKREAALEWCRHATQFTVSTGGKPWRYVLIPHDQLAENMTLAGLVSVYGQ